MYVCICKGITDRAIREQVAAGARSLAEVSRRTGCSTQCGKCSFDEKMLEENITAIYNTIIKAKPASVKGVYLKNMSVSSTMGPGIKINTNSFI